MTGWLVAALGYWFLLSVCVGTGIGTLLTVLDEGA